MQNVETSSLLDSLLADIEADKAAKLKQKKDKQAYRDSIRHKTAYVSLSIQDDWVRKAYVIYVTKQSCNNCASSTQYTQPQLFCLLEHRKHPAKNYKPIQAMRGDLPKQIEYIAETVERCSHCFNIEEDL